MEVSISEIPDKLADAIKCVASSGERVVLKRRGKSVAALVSMDDLEFLQKLEDEADIKAAKKARKEKGGVPLEKIKERLGMK